VNIFLLADDFCTPKDKVTHCVEEILNDGNRNGDKNSGDWDTFCGDGDTAGGDGAGMGLTLWGRSGDGDRDNGDGWGWGQILVPTQLSTVNVK